MPFNTSKLPTTPSLADMLKLQNYHGGVWDDVQYKARGKALLDAVRKYDPNAAWVDHHSGGEGGDLHDGFQLQYDPNKLPKNAYGNVGTFGITPWADPSSKDFKNYGNLYDPKDVKNDSNYGWSIDSRNNVHEKDPGWTKVAPVVIGGLAGVGALAGAAPAMAGVAGGTAGVTGEAAGLAAGNIASSAATGSLAGLVSNGVKSLPSTVMGIQSGNFNPALSLAGGIASSFIPGMGDLGQYIKYAQLANQAYSITRGRN